jgi:hypothetical protein
MSTPDPLTVKVPDGQLALPAKAGLPMSCAVHRLGVAVTVKTLALLAVTPPTVTTTFPVVAPTGTGTTRLVADHIVGVATVPLNRTALLPCAAPKLVPAIVTTVPTAPLAGVRLVMLGGDPSTVNGTPLLGTPPTVTVTAPLVAPLGTEATMRVAVQLEVVATVPLKRTLLPDIVPKFVPLIVTAVPTAPLVGVLVVMMGVIGPLALVTMTLSRVPVVTRDGAWLVTARPT